MEGEPSHPTKRGRFDRDFKKLTDLGGHLCARIRSRMSYPLFPGPRRFSRLPWLTKLTSNITTDMRVFISKWHLQGLVIHAKYYNQIYMDWAAMGSLIEVWHPETHTFVFPTFEPTILLEEAELLLGLKRFRNDGKIKILRLVRKVSHEEILGSFMPCKAIKGVQIQRGINLQKLADWIMNVLERSPNNEHLEELMKWFMICLAGALLFPSIDNILEDDQLGAICRLWEGKRMAPAVLAYLYSGLTASSMGQPPYGCMFLLNCWIDLHFKFDRGKEVQTTSIIFQQSPLYHMADVLGFGGNVINRMPRLKSRGDWRIYFNTLGWDVFTHAPACLLERELLTTSSLNMELQLIGATEFVLYNSDRCCLQMGLPRHSFPTLSNLPLIMARELDTEGDAKNRKAIKVVWKASVPRKTMVTVSEDCELLKAYVMELGKLRPEVPKP